MKSKANNLVAWTIPSTHVSKAIAQEVETREAKRRNCISYPGGFGPEKAHWSVYKLEYSN